MQIVAFFLLYLAWLEPLHLLPWVSWHNELLAFAAALMMFAEIIWRRRRICGSNITADVRMPTIAIMPLVVGAVVAVQALSGMILFTGDALLILMYLATVWMALTAGYNLGFGPPLQGHQRYLSSPFMLAATIVCAALVSTLWAWLQTLDVWRNLDLIMRQTQLRRPGANLAQPNQLATLILMGVVSLVYLAEVFRLRWLWVRIGGAFLLSGLAITESRTGLLNYGFLAIWWWLGARRLNGKSMEISAVVGGIFLLTFTFAWPGLWAQFHGLTGDTAVNTGVNTGAGTRPTVWLQLFGAVLERPWLGWGAGQVVQAHNAVLHQYEVSEAFSYAHNIVLDAFIGFGFLGGGAAISVVALWFLTRARKITNWQAWYGLGLFLVLGVHSMLEFPFAYAYFLVPVFFSVGLMEASTESRRFIILKWWPTTLGFGILTMIMAYSVYEYIQIEEDFRIARSEVMHIGHTPQDYERPKIVLLTQLGAMLEAIRLEPTPDMSEESMDLIRRAALRYPWSALQKRYALSLALNGRLEEAERQLKVIRALYGMEAFEEERNRWTKLADTQYPQLLKVKFP